MNDGFIENKGQIIDQNGNQRVDVKYVFDNNGFKIILKENGFSYELYNIQNNQANFSENISPKLGETKNISIEINRIDVEFIGCNQSPIIFSQEPLKNFNNYISNQTIKNVKKFKKIIYKNIYPKIDLLFSIVNNKPKYDFILYPGSNLNDIKINFKGLKKIELLTKGNLNLHTNIGVIEEHIPYSYSTNYLGSPQKKYLNINYKLEGETVVFKSFPYDKNSIIVIDPIPSLIWGTYYGGNQIENACAIVRDNNNNIIVKGTTLSSNNIATVGAFQVALSGQDDAFIAKFNSNGVRLWSTYYGGASSEYSVIGDNLAIDKNNNIIVTGATKSSNNISTIGTHQLNLNGSDDAYIIKFDSNGVRKWGTYFGGSNVDYSSSVAVDDSNNIIISGIAYSVDNIATPGAHQEIFGGGTNDAFIAKFDSNGILLWGTYYGGNGSDGAQGVTVDLQNNIIVTGYSLSANNIATIGSYQELLNGANDAFILKLSPFGNRLWGTYYGGSGFDFGQAIIINSQNDILISGYTSSNDNISSIGGHQTIYAGGTYDGFLVKFNFNGMRQWGTYYGGGGYEYVWGIAVNSKDDIIIVGNTGSNNNISSLCSFKNILSGTEDVFIAKFNSNGIRQWGTYYGGNGNIDRAVGVVINQQEDIFVMGKTNSTNNISTLGAHQSIYGGNNDMFIVKFEDIDSSYITPNGPINFCSGGSVTLTASDGFGYLWSNGETTKSIIVSQSGLYSVTVFGNTGCPNTTSSILINETTPFITADGPTNFCQGEDLILRANLGASYLWSTNETSQVITVNQAGKYSVTVTDSLGCIATSDSINIIVNLPSIAAISLSGSDTFCNGDNVILTASSGLSYIWSDGSPTQAISVSQSGLYYVRVKDFNGCWDTSSSVTITVDPNPDTVIPVDTSLCEGNILSLKVSNGAYSYIWSNGSTSDSIFIINAGSYWVDVTLGNCTIRNTIEVKFVSPPSIFLGEDTTLCFGQDITLNGCSNCTQYLWSTGSNELSILVEEPGSYFIEAYKDPCPVERDTININYIEGINLKIPNLITPNKDNINDQFEIINIIPNTELIIYNRWGNPVYSNINYNNNWPAGDVDSGIYYYLITNKNTCIKEYNGWLQILK